MELALAGKVALVTGSSRGIGRGIALTLAGEGCDLILHGRDRAALDEVAAEVGKRGRCATIEANDLHERRCAGGAHDGGEARRGPARHPRQQRRRDQAGTLPRAHRRRLAGRLWGQVLRACAARTCGLAAAQGERRLARHHCGDQRQGAGGRVHHRQLGECSLHRLHQSAGGPRQDRRRPGQHHQPRPGRDRAAVAARPRARADKTGKAKRRCAATFSSNSASPASAAPRILRASSPSSPRRTAAGCTAPRSTWTAEK